MEKILKELGFQRVFGPHPVVPGKPFKNYILRLDAAIFLEFDCILGFASLVRFLRRKRIEVVIPKKIDSKKKLTDLLKAIAP